MSDEVSTRFEAAPDGELIPIPTGTIGSIALREDAQVQVHPKSANGYYVVINNCDPSNPEAGHLFMEFMQEGSIATLEQLAAKAFSSVPHLAFRAAGLAASILASLFTTSRITQEVFIRGKLEDGTQITYCILT